MLRFQLNEPAFYLAIIVMVVTAVLQARPFPMPKHGQAGADTQACAQVSFSL
jgi:hypothetical protein